MNKEERIDLFLEKMKVNGIPAINIDLLDWLIEKGFFEKPASVNHHGNHTGGLFEHSLEVMNTLVGITRQLGIRWQNSRSPYIVGMFHDLCKIDDYVYGAGWEYNPDKILKGHGEKSIMLLSQFINLTEEEIMCIRFHMGAYETSEWNGYDKAIRKYETVLWTHTADMYASKVVGV